jgi:hypothetical protein
VQRSGTPQGQLPGQLDLLADLGIADLGIADLGITPGEVAS